MQPYTAKECDSFSLLHTANLFLEGYALQYGPKFAVLIL